MPLRQILKWPPLTADSDKHSDATSVGAFTPLTSEPLLIIRAHLRMRTFVDLRWLAVIGQAVCVLIVAYGLNFKIQVGLCFGIIAMSVWLNLVLSLGSRYQTRLKDWEAGLQLCFDSLQLALLLGVTGGLYNPFCLMLIAPSSVAAANLPTRFAIGVVILTLMATVMLAFFALPMPWAEGEAFFIPELYRIGFLTAILIGIVFTAGYSGLTSIESRRMEQALNATRLILEKEHKLAALGGLAAAAAHELGTPLGTIAVISREIMNGLKKGDALFEDAELLVSQTKRCRDILKDLSQKPETRDDIYDIMRLGDFLEAASKPLLQPGKRHIIEVISFQGKQTINAINLIHIKRRPEWLHALSAFIENATDFATSCVWIQVHIYEKHVSLVVKDDGPGFSSDILSRLGDPYISSRSFDDVGSSKSSSHSGMGLGFFIAKTLFEHTGAVITFGNEKKGDTQGGAFVKAMWRRDQIEILWANET